MDKTKGLDWATKLINTISKLHKHLFSKTKKNMAQQQHYEIAISGGGIAGVTLALMCEKLNISYILLEGRDSLESDRGAGIGMQPNGLRILDQLGIADEIEAATVPIEHTYVYDDAGNLLSSSPAVGRFTERIGYPLMFIERPKLLSLMVNHIKRKDCIRTDARVCTVEEADDHVRVTTTNGLSITADIVVGADGVRSAVRKYVDSHFSSEDKTFSADDYIDVGFSAVYGMTPPIKGIAPGERFVVCRDNQNAIGFTGTDGVVFWIVFENHHKLTPMSQAPRYTDAEAEALCQSVAHVQITPHLKFGDLLPDRTVCIKIAVEEGVADRWHTDRAVIVGDAGLKTTPAGGQGANQGIESCAVLLNNLMKAKQACAPGEKLSSEAIKSALAVYSEERSKASRIALQKSQFLCKAMLCMPGPAQMFRGLMSLPEDEWLLRILSDQANAPILDNVELTARGQLYSKTAAELRAEMARRMEAAKQAAEVRAEKEIIQETVRQAIPVE